MKDEVNGRFETTEIEQAFDVQRWPTRERRFGWGFIKLEPLFDESKTRYLMLDSDIVFLGPVIDALEAFDTDFVVQQEVQPAHDVPDLYFDPAKIRSSFNASMRDPAFTFNSGQYVATSGLIRREDFAKLVVWSEPRRVRYVDMFNPGDQGVLNYVVLQRMAEGAITVARTPFMKWGREEMAEFDLSLLNDGSPYPFVIHWAGLKKLRLRHMLRADILRHFERAYYAGIPQGRARHWLRLTSDEAERWYTRAIRVAARVRRS